MLDVHHRNGYRSLHVGCDPHEATAAGLGRVYNLVVAELLETNHKTRPILALRRHLPLIEYFGDRQSVPSKDGNSALQLEADARRLADISGLSEHAVAQLLLANTMGPRTLLRPLVFRATLGERLEIQITNLLAKTPLSLALVDDDYGIQGSATAPPLAGGEAAAYVWRCNHAGIYPLFNPAALTPSERRCLLGVLIIEP